MALHFVIPHGIGYRAFDGMSSFPSDHATFMFSLATGIWLMSEGTGFFVLLYVSFFTLLPRIYLGLHHPTDILAGAIVGILTALILNKIKKIRTLLVKPLIVWSAKFPALFYTLFFLSTYEMASMFDNIRNLYHVALQIIQ